MLSVSELSARLRGVIEEAFAEVWVRRRDLERPRLELGALLLHAEGRRRADEGRDVPVDAALPEVQARRTGCTWWRAAASACTSPRANTSWSASTWSRRGLAPLQLAFEQLKKKLAAEGLFDETRKRPLPALPRRIGIVTSIDGAALRDIVRVLRRRYPNAHLVVAPTRVQGEGRRGGNRARHPARRPHR